MGDLSKGLTEVGKENGRYKCTAFRPMDDEHHVFQCGNCGTLWKFEADGPFENGWKVCPKCGLKMPPPVCETGDGIEKRDTTVIIDQKVRFVNNETI